jgi:flavodoxin
MKNLIIYYSRRGQNYINGSIKNLDKGNAEVITGFIRNAVDADVFEVDTVKPYDKDYMVCIEEANRFSLTRSATALYMIPIPL